MKQILISTFIILVVLGSLLFFFAKEETKNIPTNQTASFPATVQSSGTTPLFNENKAAPEITGVTAWLNTNRPLTLEELRGKVVLVYFWTNQCINCIHTLPYITKWYDTYKSQNFVVIGVHTPELVYETKISSIEQAIKLYGIHFPIAQDNNFVIWKTYQNEYWPAYYLVDKTGTIRRTQHGEGQYEENEKAIQQLLKENS